jgi:hypothetical protein
MFISQSKVSSSFIHQWLYSPLLGPGLFFSFVICFTQTVGLLGRVISPSYGRYLHTEQHKHRINAHTDIHALIWIRTHDPSVRASEDSSYLRPRGHCDGSGYQVYTHINDIWNYYFTCVNLLTIILTYIRTADMINVDTSIICARNFLSGHQCRCWDKTQRFRDLLRLHRQGRSGE